MVVGGSAKLLNTWGRLAGGGDVDGTGTVFVLLMGAVDGDDDGVLFLMGVISFELEHMGTCVWGGCKTNRRCL